ncbi:MAG: acetyl-CoA carboxylase biotin carboxyl carrier protein [Thermoguttaceae bacterium]|jgi:acetyl-CoA carboxylase biotin carboxyl carrier protein
MNAPAAPSQDIFDVRKIRRLVELMKEHDLAELDLQQGEVRIQLRRACAAMPTAVGAAPQVSVAAPPAAGRPAAESVAPAAEAAGKGVTVIKSPMVGTFYAAPDPDSPPFVKVGDHVGPETVVCIVEAMKVFNQIPAEAAGRIIAVLVENGAPVEFGQPLFKVDTRE